MHKHNAMNEEDKIIRNKHILNNTKKWFDVSTALELRKVMWVVAACGIVTCYRHFEHRYRLHTQGCECYHNPPDESEMFLRNGGKQIPNHTAQQRRRLLRQYDSTYANKLTLETCHFQRVARQLSRYNNLLFPVSLSLATQETRGIAVTIVSFMQLNGR